MIDFLKLARAKNIPVMTGGSHHHTRRGWVQTHCPVCSHGRGGWHLGFNPRTGAFACWRCGGLEFWSVLKALLRTDRDGVRKALGELGGGRKGVALPPELMTRRPVLVRPVGIKPPPGFSEGLAPAHRKYLEGRGYDPDRLIEEWGVGSTSHLGGRWAWRVVIPVRNAEGRTVAYQGRTIGNAEPKYRMTDDADCLEPPDSFLYGVDRVPGNSVVIVEGATGVWRVGPGALGVLGIGWKKEQVNRLRKYARRCILFDPEPQAQKRALSLAEALSEFPGETEILSGFDVDPGELSPAQVQKIRKAARLGN